MGSTEPREYRQLYPQYRTPKFLEYKQYPHAVQNLEVLRVFAVHIPGIPQYPKYSIYPPSRVVCSNSRSWDHFVSVFCPTVGMSCRLGGQMVDVYSTLQVYSAYREYFGAASTRTTDGRSSASTCITRCTEPRDT